LELTSRELRKTAEQDFGYFQFGLLDQNAVAARFHQTWLSGSARWCTSLAHTKALSSLEDAFHAKGRLKKQLAPEG
jgi:hypothetical protein